MALRLRRLFTQGGNYRQYLMPCQFESLSLTNGFSNRRFTNRSCCMWSPPKMLIRELWTWRSWNLMLGCSHRLLLIKRICIYQITTNTCRISDTPTLAIPRSSAAFLLNTAELHLIANKQRTVHSAPPNTSHRRPTGYV